MKQWFNAISADRKKGYWKEENFRLRPSFDSLLMKLAVNVVKISEKLY